MCGARPSDYAETLDPAEKIDEIGFVWEHGRRFVRAALGNGGQEKHVGAIDGWLEGFLQGQIGVGVILLVSLLLGLRHASDPDHLAAVTTLIASEEQRNQVRKAGLMGFLWGLGHGTTLVLVGLPLVLLNQYLPEVVSQVAEVAIGCIIILLAARLLVRWRRGLYHVHVHTHGGGEAHRHVHSHAHDESHEHTHRVPRRTPLTSTASGWCTASVVREGSRSYCSRPSRTRCRRQERSCSSRWAQRSPWHSSRRPSASYLPVDPLRATSSASLLCLAS